MSVSTADDSHTPRAREETEQKDHSIKSTLNQQDHSSLKSESPQDSPGLGNLSVGQASLPALSNIHSARLSPAPSVEVPQNRSLPVHHVMTHSMESSVLTQFSRPLTPAAGGLQSAAGIGQMANFKSLPHTPQPGAAALDTQVNVKDVEGVREVMNTPLKQKHDNFPRYTASMDETDEVGECQESRRHEDLEFNSFALDLSFGGNSSFGSTADGGYSTLSRAVFHIFKGNVGAGVFLLPAFYKDAGYLLGGILIVLLGALMIDCVSLLLKIKLKADRPDVKTYPAVVGFVLGGFFLQVTKFSLIFTQFGFCVMFVQYASSIFSELFCGGGYYPLFVLLSVVVVTPFTFFSNKMGILAYASIIAGLFVAAVLVGTTAADIKYLHDDGVAPGIHAVVPTARLLVFLSGHMFSLEGIGVVLPVENSLAPQDRPTFRIVVKYTLAVVVAIYITFGILGYMAYGETLHNSVVVALPSSRFKNVLQCLLGLSLLFGYPIQYVPAIQLVDKSLGVSLEGDRKKALGLRLLLNTMFGLCAAFIGGETINIFASFLGSFVGVHLMITIPTLLGLQFENAMNGEMDELSFLSYMLLIFKGPYTLTKIKYYVYLLIGLIVWIGGMYFTFVSVFRGE